MYVCYSRNPSQCVLVVGCRIDLLDYKPLEGKEEIYSSLKPLGPFTYQLLNIYQVLVTGHAVVLSSSM